ILSPFDGNTRTNWINDKFRRDNLVVVGGLGYTLNFSGLYQELAYLYASLGDSEHALNCIDSLLFHSEGYYQNDYASTSSNASHIAAVFQNYKHEEAMDAFISGYCKK